MLEAGSYGYEVHAVQTQSCRLGPNIGALVGLARKGY